MSEVTGPTPIFEPDELAKWMGIQVSRSRATFLEEQVSARFLDKAGLDAWPTPVPPVVKSWAVEYAALHYENPTALSDDRSGESFQRWNPRGREIIAELKDRYGSRGDLERVAPGQFQESANGARVFFLDKDTPDNRSGKNIFISTVERGKQTITSARTGQVVTEGDSQVLLLSNGGPGFSTNSTIQLTVRDACPDHTPVLLGVLWETRLSGHRARLAVWVWWDVCAACSATTNRG